MNIQSLENLKAFVLAADLGSFSAAARHMNKAQSAVSVAISNMEVDMGVILFDRSVRSPVLTEAGRSLLPHAQGILLGYKELEAKANSMADDVEDTVRLAVEQGISRRPIFDAVEQFSEIFPEVSLEVLSPGPNDTAMLLKAGRADLGLMIEQESYPIGFHFRGVGHSAMVSVCAKNHPIGQLSQIAYRDLRAHRQLLVRSRSEDDVKTLGGIKSAFVWYAESPAVIMELLLRGLGWAELPLSVVRDVLKTGELVRLNYDFQQSDDLSGVDVVWTEQRSLGKAGQWLRTRLLEFPQTAWRG